MSIQIKDVVYINKDDTYEVDLGDDVKCLCKLIRWEWYIKIGHGWIQLSKFDHALLQNYLNLKNFSSMYGWD